MTWFAGLGAGLICVGAGHSLRTRLTARPRCASEPTTWRVPVRTPSRRLLAAIAVVLIALLAGVFAAAIVVAGALTWPRLRPIIDERRRRRSIEAAVPDAIDLLVLVIRAGLSPRQAVGAMVDQAPEPIRPGFVAVVARTERGHSLADALRALPDTLGPSMLTVADSLAISERHGSPISEALAELSTEVRQRRRRLAEADARKLPVRLSFPLVCCTLPSFVLVAIAPAVLAALSSLGDSAW